VKRLFSKANSWRTRRHIARLARAVVARQPKAEQRAVLFFNASARLGHLSLNAAFSQLAAWGLRLAGVPIVHFVCKRGMTHCVLGTNPDRSAEPPPCAACVSQSKRLYAGADVRWFEFHKGRSLVDSLKGRDLEQLRSFNYQGIPLGAIVLPGLRWALRRHDLQDDEATRNLFRQYILSAYSLGQEFTACLDQVDPQAVVVFNGMMYPEAMARWLAQQRGLRVITHEVGLRPFSAFFTDGEATAYPMQIPRDFRLDDEQNARLDAYLEQRFQGQFTMAGIQFWPEMQALDEALLDRLANFKHMVPVFTNVIFDTSQVHANKLFRHMFAWLDYVLEQIRANPEILFVIRAHPDEQRPGKRSRQSVAEWMRANRVDELQNVVFYDSQDYVSSYTLIQKAHFVMVYNSSIGLEASILGKPVLCAGAARYTQYKTVFYPENQSGYEQLLKVFLQSGSVAQPDEFVREARRVFYFQLFRTSLPFGEYLDAHSPGYVHLKAFPAEALHPDNSAAVKAIYDGLLAGEPFLV